MATPNTEMVVSSTANAPGPLARLLQGYQWLAKREILACAAILVLTLGLRAALLPWFPVPQPVIHDEFSYLLGGDTYAHGRLTNSTHPFWQHFETFPVLQQPTYMSKYQPLPGIWLALGEKLFGEPWIGVYLSTGLMCAATCWMLQGWIAPEMALLGALLSVLRIGVLSYWMNSYLAGSIPALGGALAFGAVARILWRRQFIHSITWTLGLAVVVLSRPYDAVVLGASTAAMLAWFLFKSRTPLRTVSLRVALPALLLLTVCGAGVAYNDYRVTGHALTLPYQANERQYAMVSAFAMIPPGPEPEYRHAALREYWAHWQVAVWNDARHNPAAITLIKLYTVVDFFFPFGVWLAPILLWPYRPGTPMERATLFLLAVLILMITPLIAAQPHYVAIFAGVLYLRFTQGLTRLWSWRYRDMPVGRGMAIALVGLLVGDGLGLTSSRDLFSQGFTLRALQLGAARHALVQDLENQPGRHLILVRYAPKHDPFNEWVFNDADIDAGKIVWAREMSPEQDRPFLDYFRNRRVWLLEPDRSPTQLSPLAREVTTP